MKETTMIRYFCTCVVLVLGLAARAMAQDCASMVSPYFAEGTTAEVTIFNGQGVVSYAKFDLKFTAGIRKNAPALEGLASQLFNDRKNGAQPFDIRSADKLELVMNLTTFQGKQELNAAFILGSWGNQAARFYRENLTCLKNGYVTAASGAGLYVIHLVRR
jgi:hypothetical protein